MYNVHLCPKFFTNKSYNLYMLSCATFSHKKRDFINETIANHAYVPLKHNHAVAFFH